MTRPTALHPGRLAPLLLVALVVGALVFAGTRGGPTSDSARVQRLTEELRCPVCDGLSVAASPSSTARAIAGDVQRRVADGQTDQQITDAYVAQYGSWIRLAPPADGFGAVVWFLPVAGVITALIAVAFVVRRRAQRSEVTVSRASRQLVDDARRSLSTSRAATRDESR